MGYRHTGQHGASIVAADNAPAKVKGAANFICDGVDDQVEINAAIQALQAEGQEGGDILLVGHFTISDKISLPPNFALRGTSVYGTRVKLQPDTIVPSMIELEAPQSAKGFQDIRNLFLDGSQNQAGVCTVAGIDNITSSFGAFDVRMRNVFVANIGGVGIRSRQCWGWHINTVVIEWCTGHGIEVIDGSGPKLVNTKIRQNNGIAFYRSGGNAIDLLVNCEFSSDVATNYSVQTDTGRLVLRNCLFGAESRAVRINGGSYCTIAGCHFSGQGPFIHVGAGDYHSITGCVFYGAADKAVELERSYCTISDNIFVGNGTGIYVANKRNTIRGNVLVNNTTGMEMVRSSANGNSIVGNTFYNNTTNLFDDDGRNDLVGNEGYVSRVSEEISHTTGAGETTVTLNHDLSAPAPYACDRIVKVTPMNAAMASTDWYVSSVTDSQVVISGLSENTWYRFQIEIQYQNRTNNLAVASCSEAHGIRKLTPPARRPRS